MTTFELSVLPGLPAYGEPARPFSATGTGMHSEGLVVVAMTLSGGIQRIGSRADRPPRFLHRLPLVTVEVVSETITELL